MNFFVCFAAKREYNKIIKGRYDVLKRKIRLSNNDAYVSASLCFFPAFRWPKEKSLDNIGSFFPSWTSYPTKHTSIQQEKHNFIRVTWRSKTPFAYTWLVKSWRENLQRKSIGCAIKVVEIQWQARDLERSTQLFPNLVIKL